MTGLTRGVALAIALVPISWARADISHSYMEATLMGNQVDTGLLGEEDATGAEFAASYELMRMLHVFGRLQYSDFDNQPMEQTIGQVGVGYNWDVTADKNLFVNLSVLTVELELRDPVLGTLKGDDDAIEAAVGWRETNHTPLEFGISFNYREYDKSATTDKWMDLNFQYALSTRFKILAGVRFGGDDNNWRIGVRFNLPDRFEGN